VDFVAIIDQLRRREVGRVLWFSKSGVLELPQEFHSIGSSNT
jgi:hypothetical protein